MMLAQENKVAASDEMEQKAWYAAEAGMKRAQAELRAKIEANENINAGWDWLAKDREVNETTDFIVLATGEALPNDGDIKSQVVKYGVYMGYEDNGQMIDITKEARTGTVTYQIYAVGVYGDMRKVIAATSEPVELNPVRNQSTDLETLLSTAGGPSSDRQHQIGGTGIRDYQNTFNETHNNANGHYWKAQQAVVADGMVHQLTNYECTIIFNSDDGKRKYYDLDSPNGSWKDWAADNNLDTLTNLYLRPATAFYPDGTMADIQYVSNQNDIVMGGNGLNTTYTACAVIINGIVYARVNINPKITGLPDTGTIHMRYTIDTGCDIQPSMAAISLVIDHLPTPTANKKGIRTINGRLETDNEWLIRQFMNNTVTFTFGAMVHKDIWHTAKPVAGYPANDACPEILNSEYPYGDGKAFDRNSDCRYQQVNYPD